MRRHFAWIGTALAVLLMMANLTAPALAATAGASSGLSITPRKDLHIDQGATVTDKLTIGNLSASDDLNVTLKPIDFTFLDNSGTPKLDLADNAPQTPWSIKPFIKLPASVVVPAGQTKQVTYTVTIPKGQGAGSYYSAIEYAATGANGGNVNLNASGVTLVFVTLPGIATENMSLQKFGAYQPDPTGTSGKFIYIAMSKAPEQLAYTLKNTGNIAEAPTGSITINNIFGKQVVEIANLNVHSQLALIGQTRLFNTCIKDNQTDVNFAGATTKTITCVDPHLLPGRYTAHLDAFYGQNGNTTHEITATATFWYLPAWFLIAVLVIILLIAGGIWWIVRKFQGKSSRGRGSRQFRR
jgi:hypothetical protein